LVSAVGDLAFTLVASDNDAFEEARSAADDMESVSQAVESSINEALAAANR
jgi:hypothetical protein